MVMNPDKCARYTVGVLVSNEPGVLSPACPACSPGAASTSRALAVGPRIARSPRITIVVLGDDAHGRAVQQLYKADLRAEGAGAQQ